MRRFEVAMILVSVSLLGCVTNRPGNLPSPCAEPVIRMEHVPQLGDHLSHLAETCVRTMAASARTWPSYEAVAGGIPFTLGIDGDGIVRFAATKDKAFKSPDGLRVGDSAAAAIAAAPHESVMQESGWGSYILLPSGWYAFLDDSRMTSSGKPDLNLGTRPLGARAKITMFFMRQ
jgi:hypothetical protein